MKKPDRWERTANSAFPDVHFTTLTEAHEVRQDVAKLLRQEHRWVRRMVQKVYSWQAEQLADNEDACYEILKQLKERAK